MKKQLAVVLCSLLGSVGVYGDVSEMVLYPNHDFSSAIAHFYHQGDKAEKYGFLFDEGFDTKRILYANPADYLLETRNDKKVKLVFNKTDRYSYMQRVTPNDFIVGNDGTTIKLLMSGGDCASSAECITAHNILTVAIPDGYHVIGYKGLDNNLKELKTKEWKISDHTYTLLAPQVKGACIYLELQKSSDNTPQAKELSPASLSKPATLVYQNTELFEKGDVALSTQGKKSLKALASRVSSSDKLIMGVFQDRVPPKRLASLYPSAEKFSKARAGMIYNELVKNGLQREQIQIEVVNKADQKTRVEAVIIPAR